MGQNEFNMIVNFLSSKNVYFEHIVHEHVHRSEEAAKIRGNKIEQAAKAIVLKVRKKKSKEYEFIQCIVSGHKKIDLKKLKILLGLDNASLASPEEVLEKTNCTVGSVPPFGSLFDLKTYMDTSVLEQEFIFFSAGTHNDSIKIKSKDYVNILNPAIMEFCSENIQN
jgi:Ala-tRNA(Pro) deacylase